VPRLLREQAVDRLFTPHTKLPAGRVPCYTTVHGLEWFFEPAGYRKAELVKQWAWFRAASRFSAGLVTFSESTHRDIRRLAPRLEVPVLVVPEGVGGEFRVLSSPAIPDRRLAEWKIERPYLLSVCSLEPRKNLDGVLRAFAKLKSDAGIPHRLVLVGRPGWKAEGLRALAGRLGVAPAVCFPGYVEDDDLVALYNGAALFVYASKYEGFGLPVLEAMACGVPVVTSNRSALPEVAGDAAILVDPGSPESIAEGILRGLSDGPLRARLVAAGIDRASHFKWSETSRRICTFIAGDVTPR
jgi:glycosyltransferase involved in cell wall biosynthesis